MNDIKFNEVVGEQHENRTGVLFKKAGEYASDNDRLHNFKVAAALQGLTPLQALAGMMAKHTVSIYDMIWSGEDYPLELWTEKFTDSQNYHDLALALVIEAVEEKKANACRESVAGRETEFEKALRSHVEKKNENDMADVAKYARTILDRAANAYYNAAAQCSAEK